MKIPGWISPLFLVTAIYDGVLGIIFILMPGLAYRLYDVTPPNHMGYVQFPACLLLIFGLMFLQVSGDPVKYRHLIVYGILLKFSFCAVTLGYWVTSGLPGMWRPFTGIDFVMGVLFVWAYNKLGRAPAGEAAARA